jgi:23S rRNA (uracil1939-C5)-methyltransferase
VQLTIEKLIYGGDGLARLVSPGHSQSSEESQNKSQRGKTVFVPFVLAGEQIEARAVEEKPGFVRAALEKILAPSPQRIAPLCPYFQRCGGCHYQHTEYAHQLAIKREILSETLKRTAKINWEEEIHVHPSPPWGYRNRTRMKIEVQAEATSFALGYYRHNSHELLPVESCPIGSPLINRAIAAIWEMGRSGVFADYALSEIEFFADHGDAKVMLELYATQRRPEKIWERLLQELRARLPGISSVSVFSDNDASKRKRAEPELHMEYLFQPQPFIYEVGSACYQVGAGSFFQTNRFLAERLLEIVCAGARGKQALDLYAGVGLFSAVLGKTFERVDAVEVAPASFHDLRNNVPQNVRVHRMTTAAYLNRAAAPKKVDLVVVDPPRAGLGAEVSRKLATLAPARLTYVSCDPATLARDLSVFLQSGYALQQVHLVDLFPQTYHIETVVHLSLESEACA